MMDGLTVTAATKYPKVDGATEQKGEPMDLIDRQAAIDAVLHHGEIENNYTDLYHDGYCDGVYDSADILKDLPSAEPKTGRWIEDGYMDLPTVCSYCGGEGERKWKYCPHCGTKMEVEADEH